MGEVCGPLLIGQWFLYLPEMGEASDPFVGISGGVASSTWSGRGVIVRYLTTISETVHKQQKIC